MKSIHPQIQHAYSPAIMQNMMQKLGEESLNGAATGLYDPELAVTRREAFVRPSVEKLTAELSSKFSGTRLQEAILKELTAPVDKARRWFEPGACFGAGTLVHTKEGLVPIEQIKVGDWVLSKPENGGEQAYKRVLQTFAHEPQRVIGVEYIADPGQGISHQIVCTVKHPFWEKILGGRPQRICI
jgi:Pretoxin HINT domain